MLGDYISPGGIMLQETCRDWAACIDRGAAPLLTCGAILPSYPEAIKRSHREMGPYMVIAPGIMLAHARPEEGAKAVGLTIRSRLAANTTTPCDSSSRSRHPMPRAMWKCSRHCQSS